VTDLPSLQATTSSTSPPTAPLITTTTSSETILEWVDANQHNARYAKEIKKQETTIYTLNAEMMRLPDMLGTKGLFHQMDTVMVKVVQHEQVKQNVPDVKARDVHRSFVCEIAQVNRERGEVGRVQAADASFPEGEEVDYGFLDTGGARFGPEQVDAKPGDDEEEIDSGEREVNDVSRDLRQPRLPSTHCSARRNPKRVIRDDGERRSSTHRVERQHAPD